MKNSKNPSLDVLGLEPLARSDQQGVNGGRKLPASVLRLLHGHGGGRSDCYGGVAIQNGRVVGVCG